MIVPSPDKAFFEKDVKAPHTIVPDDLQKKPRAAEIVEVKDQMTLKDDAGEIAITTSQIRTSRAFSSHTWSPVTFCMSPTCISPRGPIDRSDGTVAVGEVLRKLGITGATIAGGHGTLAKQADIGPALAAK